jgi:HPt (histidine-containing phosphotransfer) domain-containing protein
MNGWDAARLIRSRAEAKSRNSPIYALTAHALPEEQKALLAAGMEGCILKPLRARALDDVLQIIRSSQQDKTVHQQDGVVESVIDQAVLTELQDVLGPEIFSERLNAFQRELGEVIANINAKANARAWDKLAKLAHKFAGSAALFGAIELAKELRQLETIAKSELGNEVSLQVTRVDRNVASAAGEYSSYVMVPPIPLMANV